MNFLFAARLLNDGNVLTRKAWGNKGYVFKDEQGRLCFFDHNEPNVYQPAVEDLLANDWKESEKDCWMIVSVTHDFELIQDKLLITYHICSRQNGQVSNNYVIEERDLATWACCVDVDFIQTAQHLNEQDVAQVKNLWSA